MIKADEKIQELTIALDIVSKAKDKEARYFNVQKNKYEKTVKEQELKIEELSKTITDKDKELKL